MTEVEKLAKLVRELLTAFLAASGVGFMVAVIITIWVLI